MPRTTRPTRRRPGFTLIELLVVIAIIAVLASLTAVGVFRLIGTQQGSNTTSELTKLQGEVQRKYHADYDQFVKENPVPGSPLGNVYYNTVLPMAGGDAGRAKVIWAKLRLKQTFPQTFNEALNPAPLPPLPYYGGSTGVLTNWGYTTVNTTSPQPWEATKPWAESSVLLLLALQRGEEGGGVTPETLGVSSFVSTYGKSPNGQNVQGLVDGWHNPLLFSRWPVQSTVLNPNGPWPGDNHDAADPNGLLESPSWQLSPGYTWFTSPVAPGLLPPGHALGSPPKNGADATSYRLFPLVASCGPDLQPGIDPFTFQRLPGSAYADNLYPQLFPDR